MDSAIVTNNWGMDWAWGLPLIVLTVVIHAWFDSDRPLHFAEFSSAS
jgi:hypothetical protein